MTQQVHDFKQEHTQALVVDVTLRLDLAQGGQVDALSKVAANGCLADSVATPTAEGECEALIETLTRRIADCVLSVEGVSSAEVTVRKSHAPVAPTLDNSANSATQSRSAIIALESTRSDAETLFREAIVAIDGIPGNQVEGISPLYHVSNFDGADAMTAVIQIVTQLSAADLIDTLGTIETAHGKALDLDLVDMDGVCQDSPDCRVPWPSARRRAAVLAPWMDMDPNATLGGDPVAFLLAQAEDTGRVGLLSDAWILGSA